MQGHQQLMLSWNNIAKVKTVNPILPLTFHAIKTIDEDLFQPIIHVYLKYQRQILVV